MKVSVSKAAVYNASPLVKASPIFLALAFLALSCAPIKLNQYSPVDFDKRLQEKRERLVTDAQSFLGRKYIKVAGRYFPNDCSGYVGAVFYRNGFSILEASEANKQNMVKIIYDHIDDNGEVFRERMPKPGDIVFFSNTHRASENILSHIGIVEKVYKNGTVSFIHKSSTGIRRDYLNLERPTQVKDDENDEIFNSYMRRRRKADPPGQKYLAAQLFEAYGDIIDSKPEVQEEETPLPDEPKEEPITVEGGE